MIEAKDRMQWYVLTAIGGQEESIAQALREKMINFGYTSKVKEFKVFSKTEVKTEIFNKNDPEIPATLRKTKTIEWTALPDGRYQRTKTKVVNRFPGYIFVCCDLDDDIWYAIRNTVGVLGFVGSTGKNTKPIPCATGEFEKLLTDAAATEYAAKIAQAQIQAKVEGKKPEAKPVVKPVLRECPFKVGQAVEIISGSFQGQAGVVSSINLEKQSVSVEVEFFGRSNFFDVGFDDLKLAE